MFEKFSLRLTNGVVSFEQLGTDSFEQLGPVFLLGPEIFQIQYE